MSYLYPEPIKNETLESILFRIYLLCDRGKFASFVQKLYKSEFPDVAFKHVQIDEITLTIEKRFNIDKEMLWYCHSMQFINTFFCRQPVISQHQYGYELVENNKMKFNLTHAKFCNNCVHDSVNKFGIPHLLRQHQVGGVDFCFKHGTRLDLLPIEMIFSVDFNFSDEVVYSNTEEEILSSNFAQRGSKYWYASQINELFMASERWYQDKALKRLLTRFGGFSFFVGRFFDLYIEKFGIDSIPPDGIYSTYEFRDRLQTLMELECFNVANQIKQISLQKVLSDIENFLKLQYTAIPPFYILLLIFIVSDSVNSFFDLESQDILRLYSEELNAVSLID